ncbi:MAG TPA: LLM class flavin-dependent oxidoreductase [Mycobacteriales bacterium]|nr:LLM class flavin-dependent oxidoreductase [Mycobacteriales bacterium]
MKLGICANWGEDLDAFRTEIRTAAEHGYQVVGVGDTPAGWHDMHVSLTLAALDAPEATITPMVTSPFLRHPLISASALCSLYDLRGGNVACGLATGGSNVLALGRGRATQSQIRAEFNALRALFAGQSIEWDGRTTSSLRFARDVPIYYSAFGPKAFALAGEQADGAILFTGSEQLDGLRAKIAAVRDAAKGAARDPDDVDIWVISYASVRPTRAEAIADLKAFIAVNALAIGMAPGGLAGVPVEHRSAIEEFNRRYDPSHHVQVDGPAVQMMEELGLTEYLSEFDTSMGDVAEMTTLLRELERMGVSTFIASLPGHADPLTTIRGLAAARDAM